MSGEIGLVCFSMRVCEWLKITVILYCGFWLVVWTRLVTWSRPNSRVLEKGNFSCKIFTLMSGCAADSLWDEYTWLWKVWKSTMSGDLEILIRNGSENVWKGERLRPVDFRCMDSSPNFGWELWEAVGVDLDWECGPESQRDWSVTTQRSLTRSSCVCGNFAQCGVLALHPCVGHVPVRTVSGVEILWTVLCEIWLIGFRCAREIVSTRFTRVLFFCQKVFKCSRSVVRERSRIFESSSSVSKRQRIRRWVRICVGHWLFTGFIAVSSGLKVQAELRVVSTLGFRASSLLDGSRLFGELIVVLIYLFYFARTSDRVVRFVVLEGFTQWELAWRIRATAVVLSMRRRGKGLLCAIFRTGTEWEIRIDRCAWIERNENSSYFFELSWWSRYIEV